MNDSECGRKEPISTRESLLNRLKDWSDQESWREFIQSYGWLMRQQALRCGVRGTDVEDVLQETMFSVAKAMPTFSCRRRRGSFKSWLRKLTRWRTNDFLRKKQRYQVEICEFQVQGTEQAVPVEDVPDTVTSPLEEIWGKEWKETVLQAAILRLREHHVDPKKIQIYDMCVLRGLPVAEVARHLHVRRTQVYVARQRVSRMLRREVAELQRTLA